MQGRRGNCREGGRVKKFSDKIRKSDDFDILVALTPQPPSHDAHAAVNQSRNSLLSGYKILMICFATSFNLHQERNDEISSVTIGAGGLQI